MILADSVTFAANSLPLSRIVNSVLGLKHKRGSFSFFPCKVNIEREEISHLSLDTAYLLDKSQQAVVSGCLMSTS